MSELEDQFKKTIRGLPHNEQYRDEHLKKVRSMAMSEFDKMSDVDNVSGLDVSGLDNAGRATAGSNRSRFGFTRRHAMGAVAALLLASVSLGVVVYLGQLRQAEPQNRSTIAQAKLTPTERQLVASLQTVEDSGSGRDSAARDRALDACLIWHLSRSAEVP